MKQFFLLFFLLFSFSHQTFADDSYRTLKDIQESIKSLYAEKDTIHEKWGKFFEENGKIQEFIKPDLTEEEINTVGDTISSYTKQKSELELKLSKVSKD
jgi:hypothetical protein